jgi:MFS family permease
VPARLDPVVRRYLLSLGIARFGVGLTLPFTLILLHEVRGIALPTVGLLLAVPGVVGLLAVPVSGALVDRVGPRAVLRGCLLLQAIGTALTCLAHTPAQALPALLVTGIGLGPSFPAGNALLGGLVTGPEQQRRAYGMQFTVINAAISVGTLVGSVVVDVNRASTFVALYLTCSACCLAQVVLLPEGRRTVHDPEADAPSYSEVWADPVFRRVCVVWFLLAMTGYAALDSGLPAYARVEGGVAPSTIALAYTVNTVLIVSLQLPVLRWVAHWRRTRALGVAAGLWALSWGLLGLSQSAVAVLVFAAVFGLGEVFQSPAMQPLVNELATDRLRGRYNALSGSMYSIAFVVSPALSGLLIGNGLGTLWVFGLCVGAALTPLVLLRLRTRLTDAQDGLAVAVAIAVPG